MNIKNWFGPPTAAYTQHKAVVWFLQAQVEWRWGKELADNLNLETDVKTYAQWNFTHRIRLGEKALRGITLVAVLEDGKATTKRKPTVVHLFHRLQTIRVR